MAPFLQSLAAHKVVVVAADAGSGKSTQVPEPHLAAGHGTVTCAPRKESKIKNVVVAIDAGSGKSTEVPRLHLAAGRGTVICTPRQEREIKKVVVGSDGGSGKSTQIPQPHLVADHGTVICARGEEGEIKNRRSCRRPGVMMSAPSIPFASKRRRLSNLDDPAAPTKKMRTSTLTKQQATPSSLANGAALAVHPRARLTSGTAVEVRTQRQLHSETWTDLWLPARIIAPSGTGYHVKVAGKVVRVSAEDVRKVPTHVSSVRTLDVCSPASSMRTHNRGVSRDALERLRQELIGLYPNARLPPRDQHGRLLESC